MTDQEKEKIKDAIIDYLYDYCFNEKAHVAESGKMKYTVEAGAKFPDDDGIIDQIVNSGNPWSVKYETRNAEYGKILLDKGCVVKRFLERLKRLGLDINRFDYHHFKKCVQELCDRGFLVRNYPIVQELKLTTKGIKHYDSGTSFEQKYIDNYFIRKNNLRSKIAIWISIVALIATIIRLFV